MRKNNLLKMISLLLALVFAIGMFAACDRNDDSSEESSSDTVKAATVTVNDKDLSKYTIVHNEYQDAKDAAVFLGEKLSELFGISLTVTDSIAEKSGLEIIIENAAPSFMNDEYRISLDGDTIYIQAGINAIDPAVDAFLDKLSELYADNTVNITAENMDISYIPEATKSGLTLNGIAIEDYSIVYAEEDVVAKALASDIQAAVLAAVGVELTVKTDSEKPDGKEILVGNSKRTAAGAPAASIGVAAEALEDNNMLMYTEGDFFFLGGKTGNNVALLGAANRLLNDIECSNENKNIVFDYNTPTAPSQTSYRIMTYNDGPNYQFGALSLNYRCTLIKEYAPDIIGFQETLASDVKKYQSNLSGYRFVYFDHELETADHTPEVLYGAPIAFLSSKFTLVDSGTQWLSDTPDIPNSKVDSTDYIRTYAYAILKDKTTGEKIVVINVHVDYVDKANVKQIEILLNLTEKFKGLPMVFTGDFNMKYKSDGFKMMEDAGYRDSGRYLTKETTNIDYIFFDYSKVEAVYYKRIEDHKHSAGMAQAGSDHNPYVADIVIPY